MPLAIKKVLEGIPNRLRNSLSFRKKTRKMYTGCFFFHTFLNPGTIIFILETKVNLVYSILINLDFLNCDCIKLLKSLFAFECNFHL